MSYGEFQESLFDRLIKKLRVRRVIRQIPKNVSLLDLGCGYKGEFLNGLSRHIEQGIGYDLAVSTNNCAENVKLYSSKLDSPFPLSDESIDVVTSLAVVEHLDKPEILYQETYRVLKRGGVFIFTTPSKRAKPILEFMAFKLKIIDQKEIADHKRYYDRKELTKALIKTGFKQNQISIHYFQFGFNIFGTAKKY